MKGNMDQISAAIRGYGGKKKSAIGNKTIHHAATDLGGQVIASLSHKNEWT